MTLNEIKEIELNFHIDTSYLNDLGPLNHSPHRPPRQNDLREEVFAERWKLFMNTPLAQLDACEPPSPPNIRLADILTDCCRDITQRDATVAASFICYLGTNGGYSFLRFAEQYFAALKTDRPNSYLSAWEVTNRRQSYTNNGIRTIEYMLADEDMFNPKTGSLDRLPTITSSDLEVAQCVAIWLSSLEGKNFVDGCLKTIDYRKSDKLF